MKNCFKCNRTEEEVRLFDGIYVNEPIVTCEKCSLLEGIPIVKIPNIDQLRSSERKDYVYKRLRKIAGYNDQKPEKGIFEELKELEEKPELEKPDETPLGLVDNFYWVIQRERRRKGLSHKQLADAIGESETAVKLIERNNLPENVMPMIKKLEQFLRIKLIKPGRDELMRIEQEKRIKEMTPFEEETLKFKKDVDKDYQDEMKLEEEDEMVKEAIRTEHEQALIKKEKFAGEPLRVIDFKKEKLDRVTIADLREAHRVVEQDFPTKSSEEIGKEQLEDFGKSKDTEEPKLPLSSWSKDFLEKRLTKDKPTESNETKDSGKIPTLYELAERKKEREREHFGEEKELVGDEIEIVDEEQNNSKKESKGMKDVLGDDIEILE